MAETGELHEKMHHPAVFHLIVFETASQEAKEARLFQIIRDQCSTGFCGQKKGGNHLPQQQLLSDMHLYYWMQEFSVSLTTAQRKEDIMCCEVNSVA